MKVAGPRQFIIEFLQACDWDMVEISCYSKPTTTTNEATKLWRTLDTCEQFAKLCSVESRHDRE